MVMTNGTGNVENVNLFWDCVQEGIVKMEMIPFKDGQQIGNPYIFVLSKNY